MLHHDLNFTSASIIVLVAIVSENNKAIIAVDDPSMLTENRKLPTNSAATDAMCIVVRFLIKPQIKIITNQTWNVPHAQNRYLVILTD